jgi:hypothetical protein
VYRTAARTGTRTFADLTAVSAPRRVKFDHDNFHTLNVAAHLAALARASAFMHDHNQPGEVAPVEVHRIEIVFPRALYDQTVKTPVTTHLVRIPYRCHTRDLPCILFSSGSTQQTESIATNAPTKSISTLQILILSGLRCATPSRSTPMLRVAPATRVAAHSFENNLNPSVVEEYE